MENIRIGNDIRIIATLRGLDNFAQNSIKDVRAFLINDSSAQKVSIPVDACRCRCGHRGYHFLPFRGCCSCNPFPNAWHRLHHNWMSGCDCCHWHRGHCCDSAFIPDCELHRYLAPSKVTAPDEGSSEKKVEVYFPAADLKECGIYKMVIVVSVWEPGWGKSNVHTFTTDYGAIFRIVDSNNGKQGYISIDADHIEEDDESEFYDLDGYASTTQYGKVRLAESTEDKNGSDVVTINVLKDFKFNAEVDDNTLIIDGNSQDTNSTSGDAQDAL